MPTHSGGIDCRGGFIPPRVLLLPLATGGGGGTGPPTQGSHLRPCQGIFSKQTPNIRLTSPFNIFEFIP